MSATTLHALLEQQALAASSAVFVYDTTPSSPFGGALAKDPKSDVEVWQMQTRAGAGSALVGFVNSVAFTSKGAANASTPSADKPITVLSSTSSFVSLVPSLLALPDSKVRPALAVQVSAQTSSLATDAEGAVTLTQVPDLGAVFDGVKSLEAGGWNGAVVLSETAEQAAFVGTSLAQQVTSAGFDLVNVFDGLTAGRELATLRATAPTGTSDVPLAALLASSLPAFEYVGSASATQVLVLPASPYSATAKAAAAALATSEVGVVVVRVVKPWNAAAFQAALPASVKKIHVFAEENDEQSAGPFYEDVLSTLLASGSKFKVRALPVPTSSVPSVQDWAKIIVGLTSSTPVETPALKALLPAAAKLAVFWDLDATTGQTESVAAAIAEAFTSSNTGVAAKLATVYDNFRQGGLQQASLLLEPQDQVSKEFSVASIAATSAPALLFLSSPAQVFKAYEPISTATVGPNTRIVISANWTAEEVPAKLPYSAKKALVAVAGKTNLFVVDAEAIAAAHGVRAADVAEIAFWTLYLPTTISAKEVVTHLSRNPTFSSWNHDKLVEVNSVVRNALTQVDVESSWADEPEPVDGKAFVVPATLPSTLIPTAAGPNPDRTFADPVATVVGEQKKSWHQPAHRLLFPEAFALEAQEEEKFRPDLPEKNFLVTVTENRRLTPNTYDRNVFHIEFSTEGTGLKYAVGEALGVHGWNDADEVLEFLEWYGLDPEAIISVPSRVDRSRIEQRTIFQVFQQNLDIFGKPGKSFYETLSRYASNKNEERALRFIACPDGHATFKKMSEMDTVTYADLLRQFPSSKPTVEDLVREIEEIHPRHYSISSSQNFVGDSVHLLIVTVEWNNPIGRPRFGQCTRYLAGLPVGSKVMVSVKPSVMKLPPIDSAPVVMAGLGTGAAPFRAFIQERAWQQAQGIDVGPMFYYFGSRHRGQEYLYGEEIEAYLHEGIVTKAGLAFSRDTDKKVYIQDKINEDAVLLAKMLANGSFYLCGPTWPVPDLYEALTKAFMGEGKTKEQAEAYLEEMKTEERYVLETY